MSRPEATLVLQLWDVIKEDHLSRKHSLKVALAAVLGFRAKWMFHDNIAHVEGMATRTKVVELEDEQGQPVSAQVGCFVEGLFFLAAADGVDWLHKTFFSLYSNRMMMVGQLLTEKRAGKLQAEKEAMFKPQVNQPAGPR